MVSCLNVSYFFLLLCFSFHNWKHFWNSVRLIDLGTLSTIKSPFFSTFFYFLLFFLIINLSDITFVWQLKFLDLLNIKKLCRCFFFNFLRELIFTNFYITLKNLLTYMTRFLLPSYLRYNYFLQLFFNYWLSFKGKVVWFRSTSFRRTPICFSSEKHFKCVLKIYRFFIPPMSLWNNLRLR